MRNGVLASSRVRVDKHFAVWKVVAISGSIAIVPSIVFQDLGFRTSEARIARSRVFGLADLR